jgi:hypothetical protein
MPEYLQSMATKHTWNFKPRLRAKAFGWQGSHLACQRLKEAVAEIKKVARVDPVIAGDGKPASYGSPQRATLLKSPGGLPLFSLSRHRGAVAD